MKVLRAAGSHSYFPDAPRLSQPLNGFALTACGAAAGGCRGVCRRFARTTAGANWLKVLGTWVIGRRRYRHRGTRDPCDHGCVEEDPTSGFPAGALSKRPSSSRSLSAFPAGSISGSIPRNSISSRTPC